MPDSSSSTSSRPIRVALLLDTRAWAGTESYVLSLARALRSLPHQNGAPAVTVVVATPREGALSRRARAESIPTTAIGRRGDWDPATLLFLVRRLRRGELDIVHVHNGRGSLWGALAVKLARRGACVSTQHFIEPAHAGASGAKGRVLHAVHRSVEGGIAHHIAISGAVLRALLGRSESVRSRSSVVHNGIEIPACPPDTDLLPPSLHADIVCVARLEREKDIPTLIAAMAILNANRTDKERVRCVIAGQGEQHDALQSQIETLDAGEFVSLAGWTSQAAAILRAAKIAVLPSVAEPFGLAVLEAMAQSKPVVAVNAGGPPEIVVEGETGLLVPPRDPAALARAIQTLLDDPARAQKMGEAGFERLKSCFGAERMARQTLAVYQEVLATL